jgi:hypothetical protein
MTDKCCIRSRVVHRDRQHLRELAQPRFTAPHVFACLWLLVALLLAVAVSVWLACGPVFAADSLGCCRVISTCR